MNSVYSALKIERISHEECMFNFVHSVQDNGWRPVGNVIAIYINPFLTQQKHNGMILLVDSITKTSLV